MSDDIKMMVKSLEREQLLKFLGEAASDEFLKQLLINELVRPLRTCFHKSFGKCDVGKCGRMALFSGNAGKGGYPMRCSAHKAKTDTGVPFANQLERLAEAMPA